MHDEEATPLDALFDVQGHTSPLLRAAAVVIGRDWTTAREFAVYGRGAGRVLRVGLDERTRDVEVLVGAVVVAKGLPVPGGVRGRLLEWLAQSGKNAADVTRLAAAVLALDPAAPAHSGPDVVARLGALLMVIPEPEPGPGRQWCVCGAGSNGWDRTVYDDLLGAARACEAGRQWLAECFVRDGKTYFRTGVRGGWTDVDDAVAWGRAA